MNYACVDITRRIENKNVVGRWFKGRQNGGIEKKVFTVQNSHTSRFVRVQGPKCRSRNNAVLEQSFNMHNINHTVSDRMRRVGI